MTPLAAPAKASVPADALAAVTDAALAAQEEVNGLLATLAEISSRASIGAIRPHESTAIALQAASVGPDLRQVEAKLSEVRQRLRIAACLRRQNRRT